MIAQSSTKELMTKMGRVFLCGMIALLAAASSAADIGGQWRAEFDTQIGLQKYVFTFQIDGSKVTGKAVSEVNGQKRETELKEGIRQTLLAESGKSSLPRRRSAS
jgi:hypothetical protein